MQQGDPLGPLLFSLALRELLNDLEVKLKAWNLELGGERVALRVFYCDDGVFVGHHLILQRVLTYFESSLALSHGFHLRRDKSQVWWPCPPPAEVQSQYPSDVPQKYCSGTRVLQAPVGDIATVEAMVVEDVKAAQELLDTISTLEDSHVAFYLLRSCFGSCRLTYLLRCVPTESSLKAAQLYDIMIERSLRGILGGVLSPNVFRELQLPVKAPGPSFGVGLFLQNQPLRRCILHLA